MSKRVVIRQADLDTCVTAFVLGVVYSDEIVVTDRADASTLADSSTLCIEVGGSGHVVSGNFDHHDAGGPSVPACRQAFDATRHEGDVWLARLISYAEMIDLGQAVDYTIQPAPPLLTISALVSGIRLVEPTPERQLCRSLALLEWLSRERLDPFTPAPPRPEWDDLISAKAKAAEVLQRVTAGAALSISSSGLLVGFLVAHAPGALGALYTRGCDVVVAYQPALRKYTIGGRDQRSVDHLLPFLNALEPGWGGPMQGSVIGSPFGGSSLASNRIVDIVREPV